MFEFISLILALLAIFTMGFMFVTGLFFSPEARVITSFGLVALVLSGAACYFAFNADSFAAEAFRVFSVIVTLFSFILTGAGFSAGISHIISARSGPYRPSESERNE